MIFESLITSFCLQANLKSGCNEALISANKTYHISKEIDESEVELNKIGTKEAYSLLGRKTVEYTLTAGSIANIVVTKSLQFKTPFKPLANELQVNGSQTGWTLNMNWDWK